MYHNFDIMSPYYVGVQYRKGDKVAYKTKQAESQEEWRKKNMVQKKISLNKNTDDDIIEYLKTLDNVQGYIKQLIRDDIANGN